MASARRSDLHDLWRRGQHGWPASYPVAQFPNAPLLFAFAGSGVAALTSGSVHDYARGAFYTGLGAWAFMELSSGVNGFRRGLGAAGVAYVVVKLGALLGA